MYYYGGGSSCCQNTGYPSYGYPAYPYYGNNTSSYAIILVLFTKSHAAKASLSIISNGINGATRLGRNVDAAFQ